MATNFQAELRLDSPICHICSNHPLAVNLINQAISSDPELRAQVKPYSDDDCKPSNDGRMEILILDTCSVLNWADCFQEWHNEGGRIIGLIPADSHNRNVALKMLHLGAAGILTFSENLAEELLRAIHTVTRERVWIRREVMDAYLNWTRSTILNLSVSDQRLTGREKQILDLLQQDLSNRMIAQKLALSERTIKFHVSNILRKLKLTSRRELQSLDCSNSSFPFLSSSLSLMSEAVPVSDLEDSLEPV